MTRFEHCAVAANGGSGLSPPYRWQSLQLSPAAGRGVLASQAVRIVGRAVRALGVVAMMLLPLAALSLLLGRYLESPLAGFFLALILPLPLFSIAAGAGGRAPV